MISESSIELVKSTTQVQEVVSDFVKLKKHGANLTGICPFHTEKSPSFTVSATKQIYKCFGCGRSGDAISFLVEHEKIGYLDAIKWLANKYNIELEEYQRKEYVKPVARLEKVSPEMIKWFEARGISNNTLLRFGITMAREFMPGVKAERNCICFNYFRDGELVNIKFRCEG